MAKLSNEKILGGIGSILIILGFIPWLGWVFGIAGIVLLFIAMNKLSQVFSDKNIFNKFLTGSLISIGGILIGAIMGIFSMLSLMLMMEGPRHMMSLPYFGFIILIVYVLNIVGMYFYRQCFNLIKQYTEVNLFKLSGDFMFWGAVGVIVFGLGVIAILVGWILLAIAFFSIPDNYKEKTT